ncbi:glycosyl hydrolase family 28-related protein [Oceaniglobus ichthyenteri]|uniref:glycosyl hydrolase family 28-related protein n=1 Tax=Oceaniglobus ichthyenteri TaxID=2136177 RepID=UPI000D387FF5|nr:glycosyl hydrolase family 28-related protein [Oceaniglobus ichthyenteri]
MNKAITDGLVLMPPPFSGGLNVWSSEDGTPGSATYAGASNAAFVPADQDFGGCLELIKTQGTQRLRYTGETPILPGCYLQIRARVKAVTGNLPGVRIAAYGARAGGNPINGVVTVGPTTQLSSYGDVVEVRAIVGVGARNGVDMVWGRDAIYGHFGLDLTGPNGGVVRIDDIEIEDVTGAFLRSLLDFVDVRDYGAVGNGSADDSAAFNAADAAANGRYVVVPEGNFRLNSDVTMANETRFVGKVSMPVNRRLVLRKNFDLPTYIDAFGNEVEAFKKAFQALLNNTDHESLDMGGRRIELSEPIDMAAAVDNLTTYEIRRVIRNGQFNCVPGTGWNTPAVSSSARYSENNPRTLTQVTNVANIEVGSLVTGNGVGREVYVSSKNVGQGTISLSQPLYDAVGTQNYTFRRFRYALDFSGFNRLSKFTLADIEFQLDSLASGIMMAPDGETFHVKDCFITKPKHRGITSIGRGCQDLQIDRCHFISAEQSLPATQRISVGLNINANDGKIRDSRFQRLGTTMVLFGNGHLLVGNHWFQGDNVNNGPRTAGLVLTETNVKTVITGCYIDNSFIEWTNEHDAQPGFANEFSFGGLSITGCIFTANNVASWFSWLVIKPFGPGHFVQGLNVVGNTFKSINGQIDRIDRVDTSIAGLDHSLARLINFQGNTFNGIQQLTINPVTLEFSQNDNAETWTLGIGGFLPFQGYARTVCAVVPEGELLTSGQARVYDMPSVTPMDGPGQNRVRLGWSVPTRGRVQVTARCDKPF